MLVIVVEAHKRQWRESVRTLKGNPKGLSVKYYESHVESLMIFS